VASTFGQTDLMRREPRAEEHRHLGTAETNERGGSATGAHSVENDQQIESFEILEQFHGGGTAIDQRQLRRHW